MPSSRVTGCIAAACALAVCALCSASAGADAYTYQFMQKVPRGRQFNIIATIKPTSQQPSACILFCARDKDNCYRVELTGSATRIVKVDMGMEVPIGTTSDVGLLGSASRILVVKRGRMTITAALDGRVVAEAYDDTFTRGRMAQGVHKGTVKFEEVKTYDCGEVHFGDDFMTETALQWKPISGSWSVLEASNPTTSANPFKYSGKSQGGAALSAAQPPGSINWDNYSASVRARDDGGAPIGLAFYYGGPKNYHLFRCSSRRPPRPIMEIVRVRDGAETVLASTDGGYIVGQFYRFRVDVDATTVRAFVDDNLVLTAQDDSLVGGSIGLYTESKRGAVFDDVLVRDLGYGYFKDSFASPRPGTYLELGGKWVVDSGVMTGTSKGPGKAVTGDPRWRNYVLACHIQPPASGAAGLVFYYQDELNHFLYRVEGTGRRELIRYYDGVKKVLASVPRPLSPQPEHTVISNIDGLIRLSVEGEQIAEEFDPGLSEGKIGLYVEDGAASFGRLEVNTPPPAEPVLSITDAFKAERLMAVFAADQRDWMPADRTDTRGRKWWWHRANLFGEATVELDMRKEKVDNTSFQLALAAEATGPGSADPASGYTLTVWKTGAWQLSIARRGTEIARAASVFKDSIWKIDFQRKGRFLFGRINRKLEVWVKDERPLRGSRAGYALVPPAPDKLRADVYCPNLLTYTFSRSAVDWRVAAGTWEVMNRWSCDERWSWFGGRARNGPAIIWNKRTFGGDFSLEFCGAIRMEPGRGGEYKYARDMNATVAADGRDLTSGYSLIFGGWGNTLSCLARGEEIVARPKDQHKCAFSGSSSMHRQWWYFKIERVGRRLRWFVDNELVLEYDDPQPLHGGRIALWAYDIGIMVARVRIAAEKIGLPEHPGFPGEAKPKTIYDFIPDKK